MQAARATKLLAPRARPRRIRGFVRRLGGVRTKPLFIRFVSLPHVGIEEGAELSVSCMTVRCRIIHRACG